MARSDRQIRLYAIHGRADGVPVDYVQFFDWLTKVPPSNRLVNVLRDLAIGLERVQGSDGIFRLRLNAGDPTAVTMVVNPQTGIGEVREDLAGYPGSETRVTVDANEGIRLVSLESRRNGISATNLSRYFNTVAETQGYGESVNFDLVPLASESFEREIERFERIREASIVVTRPNFDWSDDSSKLSELAEESGGEKVEATVRAGRSGSLATNSGIVDQIKRIARMGRPSNIADARVRGVREGEQSETSVSLDRHQVRARVAVATEGSSIAQDDRLWSAQQEMLDDNRDRALELGQLTLE